MSNKNYRRSGAWEDLLWVLGSVVLVSVCVIWLSVKSAPFFASDHVPDVDGRYHGFTKEELMKD